MDLSSAIGIALLAALYIWAARRLKRRPTQRQVFFFCLLILAMLVTFGPLDELADARSFWAHMLEHSFQSWVIPPLFLLAVPDWMFRPVVMSRPIEPLARFFSNPVAAFVTFTVVYVFVHDPPVFNFMLVNETFHITVHIFFMVAGTILFWPLLSPMPEFPRLSYPAQILYLFLLMVPMTAVAAPITLADSVTYPWYAAGPHPFGLAAHEDQVIGGILMWVADSFYLMLITTLIFFRWARNDEIEVPAINLRRPPELRVLRPTRNARA
ncbi:MAG TPA: cytochrome c oxidase assembly protein [Candidatus Binataceae bacterium]|nr:cytochrome c oxidase assembly protein [Candidatus Binataceae bacterium]